MKWVVFIQNQISEVGQLLVMHVEELRRLRRKLDVVEQIHVSFQLRITKILKLLYRLFFNVHKRNYNQIIHLIAHVLYKNCFAVHMFFGHTILEFY